MDRLYERINWENEPSLFTPINDINLNKMDAAIYNLDGRTIDMDITKANESDALQMFNAISYDEKTGKFTFKRKNGTTVVIDTLLEKVVTNFRYDPTTQQLILTTPEGESRIDLSALITQYEFEDSSAIKFDVVGGKVVASLIDGGVTASKLQPNFLADCESAQQSAGASANRAYEEANRAEAQADRAEASAGKVTSSIVHTSSDILVDSQEGGIVVEKMYGCSEQNGRPTATNLIEIKNVEVKLETTGKNLIPFPYYENSVTRGGITFTTLADGSISASGTASTNTYIRIVNNTQPLFIEKGARYRLSEGIVSNDIRIGLLYRKGSSAVGTDVNDGQNGTIFTVPTDLDFDGILIQCWIRGGTTVNNVIFKPMLTKVVPNGTPQGYYPTKFESYRKSKADTSILLRGIPVNETDYDGVITYYKEIDIGMFTEYVPYVADTLEFVNGKFRIVRRCAEYKMADLNNSAIKSSGNDGENTYCYRWTIGTYTTVKNKPQEGMSNINIITKGGSTDLKNGYGYINVNSSGGVLVYLSLPKDIDTLDKAKAFAIENDLKVIMREDVEVIEEVSDEDAIKLLGLKSWEDLTSIKLNSEVNANNTIAYGVTDGVSMAIRGRNLSLADDLNNPKSMISDEWLSTKTYAQGEYCISNNSLWKSKVNNNLGNVPTEGSYWTVTSICNELIALWNK